ncbi:hypothetical protein CHELA20_54254 [Hyphomicrobiales bacterium]|nr:hypothetical protein CHELA41_20672 [Hyphomicrobiales bacterium]CAH1685896.1 hypothetical protein CHELA20_54254 [Hyphomicrobiales bacterium]
MRRDLFWKAHLTFLFYINADRPCLTVPLMSGRVSADISSPSRSVMRWQKLFPPHYLLRLGRPRFWVAAISAPDWPDKAERAPRSLARLWGEWRYSRFGGWPRLGS